MDFEEKFSLAIGWGAGFTQIEFDTLFYYPQINVQAAVKVKDAFYIR